MSKREPQAPPMIAAQLMDPVPPERLEASRAALHSTLPMVSSSSSSSAIGLGLRLPAALTEAKCSRQPAGASVATTPTIRS